MLADERGEEGEGDQEDDERGRKRDAELHQISSSMTIARFVQRNVVHGTEIGD